MLNTIETKFGAISVDHIQEHKYKPGIFIAQVRQVVTRVYPSTRVGNSYSDQLFEIDLPEGKSFDSTRVTWVPVRKGLTVDQVQQVLDNKEMCPNPRIYRRISNNIEDVLTNEQLQSIEAGLKTLEDYAESHLVRQSDGSLISGPDQYTQNFFSKAGHQDVDLRSTTTVITEITTDAEEEASATMGHITA